MSIQQIKYLFNLNDPIGMFRRFFSDKKEPEPTWKFGVSLDKSAIWVKSEEWTKEIQQFEELRRDFRSLLVFEDIDLFTKIVPIGKVDEQIARNMLPENQTQGGHRAIRESCADGRRSRG